MPRLALLLILLTLSCKRTPPADSETSQASEAKAKPSKKASQAASAPPPAPIASASILTYDSGEVDECDDIVIYQEPGLESDPVKVRTGLDERVAQMLKDRAKNGANRLTKSCMEQLAERDELATCTVSMVVKGGSDAGVDGGALKGVRLKSRAGYYNVRVLDDSDSYMKECLDSDGEWNALPADHPKVKRARHMALLKKTNKVLKTVGDE